MTENLNNQIALEPNPVESKQQSDSMGKVHGGEIVTLDEARNEWNQAHGTYLEAHNDALTAEQEQRINDTYDTEIYVGTHGPSGGVSPDHPWAKSIQYDEVATVIGGMEPGDTLFVEGFGFTTPTPTPRMPEQTATSEMGEMAPMLDLIMRNVIEGMAKNAGISMAELQRKANATSAWGYAEQLAAEKSIPVVYADLAIFD